MKEYRADIEGLRALAVLPVIFFHYGLGCSGGYVGVDIFFVISGFLITSLLLRDQARGGISLPDFWERRVRRIWPALVAMVAAVLVFGWFFFLPADFQRVGRSIVSQVYFGSNFYFWRHTGYFDPSAESQPLLHTWSLAVEEQFYLFFPLLLMGLAKMRIPLRPALCVLAAVSLGLSVAYSQTHASASFFLPHTRAWELALGAILATLNASALSTLASELLSGIGLAAIALSVFTFDEKTIFPGVAALLPCVGAACIIKGQAARLSFLSRALTLAPVVWIGRISYSLYLWHWPLLVCAKYSSIDGLSGSQVLLLFAPLAVVSFVSWRFVETPFRKHQLATKRSSLFRWAAVASSILFSAGLLIGSLRGIPSRLPAAALRFAAASNESSLAARWEMSMEQIRGGKFLPLTADSAAAEPELVVWGDSHAMAVMSIISETASERGVHAVAATHSSTAPLLDFYCLRPSNFGAGCTNFNAGVLSYIQEHHVRDVLLVASWSSYLSDAFFENHGPFYGPEALRAFEDSLKKTVTALHRLGCRVTVMEEVPTQRVDVPRALAKAALAHRKLGNVLNDDAMKKQFAVFEVMTKAGCEVLYSSIVFMRSGSECVIERDGEALYRDEQHLSIRGARELRNIFEPFFSRMKARVPE